MHLQRLPSVLYSQSYIVPKKNAGNNTSNKTMGTNKGSSNTETKTGSLASTPNTGTGTTETSPWNSTRAEQAHRNTDGTTGRKIPIFSQQWSALVKKIGHRPILAVLRPMARISALNPKTTIFTVIVLSLGLIVTGLFTNFTVDVNTDKMWTPIRSYPVKHMRYIAETFEASPRYFVMFFHSHGDDVLNAKSIRRAFEALDTVRGHPEYEPICSEFGKALVTRPDGSTFNSCDIYGVTRFWWNNSTEFEMSARQAANESDPTEERFLHTRIAKRAFPDQFPVLHDEVFGFLDYNVTYATSAKSFTIVVYLPEHERTRVAEMEMVDDVLALNEKWQKEDDTKTGFRVEALADESIGEELVRAVEEDIPLIPIIFVAMSIFTAFCFSRRHAVYSRAALGAAAVFSVMFSIMSGFGLLFIFGSPFSTCFFIHSTTDAMCIAQRRRSLVIIAAPITQLLPFLIL
jgi:Patched family